MFSFTKNRKTVDMAAYLRRICDITTPNHLGMGDEGRSENRYNRTMPVLICPWRDEQAVVEKTLYGLTSDISDRGISLTLAHPHPADDLLLGLWASKEQSAEPWFFLGSVCSATAMGGGFWTIGVALSEYANDDYSEQLLEVRPKAEILLPPVKTDVS